MKTVQQIMQETGAQANIQNFRYMQENYSYDQKVRHAQNVAARRAKPKPKSAPAMTIAEVVRAADAMGLSYGQFVARGLDKVWRG